MLLFCLECFCSGPSGKVAEFYKFYKEKDLKSAAGCVNIAYTGSIEEQITRKALEKMWDTFFDKNTRRRNTREIIKTNLEEIKALKEELLFMKQEECPEDSMAQAKRMIAKMENDITYLESMVEVVAEVTGMPVDEKIIDDYAMVVTKARVDFPQKIYREIKNYIEEIEKDLPSSIARNVTLSKNSLTFPVIFYLINTSGGWRLMLFSQEGFPEEAFSGFLKEYDASFAEFGWMAGTQAQAFWDEASAEIRNNTR